MIESAGESGYQTTRRQRFPFTRQRWHRPPPLISAPSLPHPLPGKREGRAPACPTPRPGHRALPLRVAARGNHRVNDSGFGRVRASKDADRTERRRQRASRRARVGHRPRRTRRTAQWRLATIFARRARGARPRIRSEPHMASRRRCRDGARFRPSRRTEVRRREPTTHEQGGLTLLSGPHCGSRGRRIHVAHEAHS